MKAESVPFDSLRVESDLERRHVPRTFAKSLEASIAEIGLLEPLKVARKSPGEVVIVDGVLRYRAMDRIRESDPSRFSSIPAYFFEYRRRHEIRFQTDIYQDLLPSQMAALVEALHEKEGVSKADIARSLGVAPATLRNYTGLWRLTERGGLSARVVELMDVGVVPSSNPYAWLRLRESGIRVVLKSYFSDGLDPDVWIDQVVAAPVKPTISGRFVEQVTGTMAPTYYLQDAAARTRKKEFGLQKGRANSTQVATPMPDQSEENSLARLKRVISRTESPVLRVAAESIRCYLVSGRGR